MLLQHAWLAPLLKPDAITEEDEEAAERGEDMASATVETAHTYHDQEVAEWVQGALERKREGKTQEASKPALHKVALDSVGSPTGIKNNTKPVAVDG
jgi:mitogen-activated protein kinase kinase